MLGCIALCPHSAVGRHDLKNKTEMLDHFLLFPSYNYDRHREPLSPQRTRKRINARTDRSVCVGRGGPYQIHAPVLAFTLHV